MKLTPVNWGYSMQNVKFLVFSMALTDTLKWHHRSEKNIGTARLSSIISNSELTNFKFKLEVVTLCTCLLDSKSVKFQVRIGYRFKFCKSWITNIDHKIQGSSSLSFLWEQFVWV